MADLGSFDTQSRVGLVVATHAPLARALLDSARDILGERWGALSAAVTAVEIDAQTGSRSAFEALSDAVAHVDQGCGVLVMADLFGGSAANIALAQLGANRVEVVTGVNLPMLLKALTQRHEWDSPAVLGEIAAEAGRESILVASSLLTPRSRAETGRADAGRSSSASA